MLIRLVLLAALPLTLPAVDFSGSWALVLAKSDFGAAKPPQSLVMTVKQSENQLAVKSTLVDARGSSISAYTLDLSGHEAQNSMRGNQVVSITMWRGPMLHVKAKTMLQGTEIKTVDQWQMDESGRVLTIFRTATTPKGDIEQRFVYVKSPANH